MQGATADFRVRESNVSIANEKLPLKADGAVARLIGRASEVHVQAGTAGELPKLRVVLPRPASARQSLMLRVHSRMGVPLAWAAADVQPGDQAVETATLTVLAMEGYSHLGRAEREAVEGRVWSRRAFATASLRPHAVAVSE